jgi:hypothetical protein
MMAVTPSPRPHQRQHKQFESEENILHVCVDQSTNELLFSLGKFNGVAHVRVQVIWDI